LALPVKALKVGQEGYWLDQIAKDREEYFSGKGESPGRYVGARCEPSRSWRSRGGIGRPA
jgi:hypothetical protein